MSFKLWLENTIPTDLSNVHSKQELADLFSKLPSQKRQVIFKWSEEINREAIAKRLGTTNPIMLYHGSPVMDLDKQGMKLTKGYRGHGGFLGALGANYEVNNLGVFMTDSKPVAHYFGQNRSDNYHNVYSAYCRIDNPLDATSVEAIRRWPPDLRKLGTRILREKEEYRSITKNSVWQLLDESEFVETLKGSGYDAVKFKESAAVYKLAGVRDAMTYFIMNPAHVLFPTKEMMPIRDFDTLWDYLKIQEKL